MRRPEDFTGRKFGLWSVLGFHGLNGRRTMWDCVCECGEKRVVNGSHLKRGKTRSCGCLRNQETSVRMKGNDFLKYRKKTHRLSHTREYFSLHSAINRCTKPSCATFPRYGGAGIFVCQRWMDSFEAFIEDMGFAPTNKHTLDRIDNTKGYSKENCRWATMQEQQRNRRDNISVTAFGETKLLCEWMDDARCVVSGTTMANRIRKGGWKPEAAIATPSLGYGRKADPSMRLHAQAT